MEIKIYCQSYNISSPWGSWFNISSQEDISNIYKSAKRYGVEEICTADSEFFLDYDSLGGESMLYFLQSHWEQLEYIFSFEYPEAVFEFLFNNYDIQKIFDMIENFEFTELDKGENNSSVEVLAGYYFFDFLDTKNIPKEFITYFDYEAYGRDILFEYEVYERKDSFYLFSLS